MTGRFHKTAYIAHSILFAQALGAQSTPLSTAAVPRCYHLRQGEWSRSLGVNARYHALPAVIRLDTARAARGGWTVTPDIAFPTPNHFPGTPRWMRHADTIEIVWSNGYQGTTVRLGSPEGNDLRGTVTVSSDANEFGTDIPHASIVARPVSCAELR